TDIPFCGCNGLDQVFPVEIIARSPVLDYFARGDRALSPTFWRSGHCLFRFPADVWWNIFQFNYRSVAQYDAAFYDVLEFAHISWKRIMLQGFQGVVSHHTEFPVHSLAKLVQEMIHQDG